MSYLVLANKF